MTRAVRGAVNNNKNSKAVLVADDLIQTQSHLDSLIWWSKLHRAPVRECEESNI